MNTLTEEQLRVKLYIVGVALKKTGIKIKHEPGFTLVIGGKWNQPDGNTVAFKITSFEVSEWGQPEEYIIKFEIIGDQKVSPLHMEIMKKVWNILGEYLV